MKHSGILALICCILFSVISNKLFAQVNFDSLLASNPALKKVWSKKDQYHLQLVYTRIVDSAGQRLYKDNPYNTGASNYLYCASLIKLPVAVLCLKKANDLGLDIEALMYTDSSRACHRRVYTDSTAAKGRPSLKHYLKRMMLVSDNDAYNRCFEFLGTDYIHHQLAAWSYPNVRIINRYETGCAPGTNRYTNPVRICDSNQTLLYSKAEEFISAEWTKPLQKVSVGRAYRDFDNKWVNAPKDFSYMNYMTLSDVHRFLKELLISGGAAFGLSAEQFLFLEQVMTMPPSASDQPRYDSLLFPDNYKKYLLFEDGAKPGNDRTFESCNVVGLSYGFISDCARIRDRESGIEFFLSAGLYVNQDEVLNDGKYEYNSIGRPFLSELGKQILAIEKKRHAK